MPATKIRGNTQIQDATIENAQIAAAAAIDTSKLAEGSDFIQRDGSVAFTADQSMGTNQLTNVGDPVADQDAATRAWVLAQVAGISTTGAEARMASTGNLVLSGVQTVDGIAGSAGDVVLVKNQTAPAENGLYAQAAGAWTRTTNADSWDEVSGLLVVVREGSTQADTLWLSTADSGGTLGTTAINWIQLPGPSDILAGAGLTRTGQTIDFVAADASLTVGANNAQVARDAAGAVGLSGTGLQVEVDGTSIERSSNAVRIAAGAAGAGLGYAAGVLSTNVDNATVEVSTDALQVKDLGITTAKLADTSITSGKLGTGARRVVRETPTGAVNGSNTTFTLANTPSAGTEEVYLNGILQEPGAGNDYTISGGTITYLTAPLTGDRLRVSYMY
jgi:hypothetical protein